MSELPDKPNFFSTLHTSWTCQDITSILRNISSGGRKCGWDEWEVEFPFGFVYIESRRPVLMRGCIANVTENADRLLECLQRAGIRYEAEAYCDDGELLKTYKWSPV